MKYSKKIGVAFGMAWVLSLGMFSNIALAGSDAPEGAVVTETTTAEESKTQENKTEIGVGEKGEKPESPDPLSDETLLKQVEKDNKEMMEAQEEEEVAETIDPKDYIPILAYHHFVEEEIAPGNGATLSAAEFESHLQYFMEQGYTFLSLEELNTLLANSLDEKNPAKEFGFDEKYICLTIDDGYRSNYELAYPLLQKYNVKADISVITSRIHSSQIVSKEILKLCWSELDEMQESGLVAIYNHTNDHIRAEEKFTNAFLRSAEDGEKDLNNKLKKRSPIRVLTYPNGGNTLGTRVDLRNAGYDLQLTTDYGVVHRKTSVAKIPRITVSSGMTGEDIMTKIVAAAEKSFSQ